MRQTSFDRLEIVHCSAGTDREAMKREILDGLTAPRKFLPSKYFYDGAGSELFERICTLPEYYQTRTELSILRNAAPAIMENLTKGDLVELGSGANWKIRTLLDAANGSRRHLRYVPVDVCEPAIRQASEELLSLYPDLTVSGIVADFHHDMDRIIGPGDKLITFFGGTIGNFNDEETSSFLKRIAGAMNSRDRFLMGIDMIKPKDVLEAAYNDAQGVTAAFNKNILAVLNRELRASFDLAAFDHLAFYNDRRRAIEMHLRVNRDVEVEIRDLDLSLSFSRGETIFTEISRKFSREKTEALAADAGLKITRWFTDRRGWFSLVEMTDARSA